MFAVLKAVLGTCSDSYFETDPLVPFAFPTACIMNHDIDSARLNFMLRPLSATLLYAVDA